MLKPKIEWLTYSSNSSRLVCFKRKTAFIRVLLLKTINASEEDVYF